MSLFALAQTIVPVAKTSSISWTLEASPPAFQIPLIRQTEILSNHLSRSRFFQHSCLLDVALTAASIQLKNHLYVPLLVYMSVTSYLTRQMPCICIKEALQPTKHLIEGIELNCKVGELREKAAEKTNIPIDEQTSRAHSKVVFWHRYFSFFNYLPLASIVNVIGLGFMSMFQHYRFHLCRGIVKE